MIAYDMVLENLPERVRELTVRLRDLVLSLGGGIDEQVRSGTLEYSAGRKFCALAPDRTGVSVHFPMPLATSPEDPRGQIAANGRSYELRLASAWDIDDRLRRMCKQAFDELAQGRHSKAVEDTALELSETYAEALRNTSRGLRLLIHHMQAAERAAVQRAAAVARQGQKRSHKKKPPPTPPPLPLPSPLDVTASPADEPTPDRSESKRRPQKRARAGGRTPVSIRKTKRRASATSGKAAKKAHPRKKRSSASKRPR
jgi:hypothetical protein